MAIITFDVTAEDIRKDQTTSKPRITSCALYHAGRRVIPNIRHIGTTAIALNVGHEVKRIELPDEAKLFVAKADNQACVRRGQLKEDSNDVLQEPLRPFKFQMHIPDEYIVR